MAERKVSRFERNMENFGTWVEKYVAPPLVKFGNQRHMAAIRTAYIRIIPFIIVGSVPLILTNLPIPSLANLFAPYADKLNVLYSMTFNFIGLWLAISLGAEMAKMYGLDQNIGSIVTVACSLIVVSPIDLSGNTLDCTGLSVKGMFSIIIVSVIAAEFMKFAHDKNLTIRMPKGVPANIATSFGALIPMSILATFFWAVRVIIGFDLTQFLNIIISPLLVLQDTGFGVLVCVLLLQLLWFVGIHGGSFTVWGVCYPLLITNIAENTAASILGQPLPHVFTEPFVYTWIMIGGVGSTLPLCLIWWKSKSATLREVAHLALPCGIFNINEPIIFGAPIAFNPIMFVPFMLSGIVGSMFAYFLTRASIITAAYVPTPWTTPLLINPYLSSGGDVRCVIAQVALLVILFIIYYPFAKIWEARMIEEEKA